MRLFFFGGRAFGTGRGAATVTPSAWVNVQRPTAKSESEAVYGGWLGTMPSEVAMKVSRIDDSSFRVEADFPNA